MDRARKALVVFAVGAASLAAGYASASLARSFFGASAPCQEMSP
jgi:hypothetical protein